jgi:hypothetical protein
MRRISDDDEVDPCDPYAAIKRDRAVVAASLKLCALAVYNAASWDLHHVGTDGSLADDRRRPSSSSV